MWRKIEPGSIALGIGIVLLIAIPVSVSLAAILFPNISLGPAFVCPGVCLLCLFAGIAAGKLKPHRPWAYGLLASLPVLIAYLALVMVMVIFNGTVMGSGILSYSILLFLPASAVLVILLGSIYGATFPFGARYPVAAAIAFALAGAFLAGPLAGSPFNDILPASMGMIPGWLSESWLFALYYFAAGALFGLLFSRDGWKWGLLLASPSLVLLIASYYYYRHALLGGDDMSVSGVEIIADARAESLVLAVFAAIAILLFLAASSIGAWLGAAAGAAIMRRRSKRGAQ